jgi:hypothetical protein
MVRSFIDCNWDGGWPHILSIIDHRAHTFSDPLGNLQFGAFVSPGRKSCEWHKEDRMLNRMTMMTVWTAAVLALGAVVVAQNNHNQRVAERFSFVVASAANAGPSGEGRMAIVINQWSPDTERDRLITVLKTEGPEKMAQWIGRAVALGYINWPNHLQYTIRFASRLPRPDGGEDVILATDYPVHVWWDAALGTTPTSLAHGTVIQLQLNRDGRGEGKLSTGTRLTLAHDGRLFALEDYATQPVVLTDVQRDPRTT